MSRLCEQSVDLKVRGELPRELEGSLLVACNRRNKDRNVFSRWHDSQTDLVRIDIMPGKPGKALATVLEVDSTGKDVGAQGSDQKAGRSLPVANQSHYLTQPNHGLNVENGKLWATNLLFGFPLEVDIRKWESTRLLQAVDPVDRHQRVTSTAHFAFSLDRRYAYFHESVLTDELPAKAADLRLVRMDSRTGSLRVWEMIPPVEDCSLESANFHSAFYFEENGNQFVGLLKTGAVVESLAPHNRPSEHLVMPSTKSTIWIVPLDTTTDRLQARLLPGLSRIDAISLSHLDVDNEGGNGFVLYANYKEADVAEETHGINVYGEQPSDVTEHYSGMTVEALNVGTVMRVTYRNGKSRVKRFRRAYNAGRTSLGHSWLPINIQLDTSRKALFCTFSGFRPRLLPRHIAQAYPGRVVDANSVYYVPPALIRLGAESMKPDFRESLSHISYAEPIAMCVVGSVENGFVCTFSPELGLRVYRASDLSRMVAHVTAHPIWHFAHTHFRPTPAHMKFVAR